MQIRALDALIFVGGPVDAKRFGAIDCGVDGVVKGKDVRVKGGRLPRLADAHRTERESGALEEMQHPGDGFLLVLRFDGVFPKESKAHKAGRRTPVARQTLRAAAGEALLLPVARVLHRIVIQIPQARIGQQIGAVPGIAGAVCHHTDGVAVEMQAIRVRFDHDGFPRPIAERPMQRRHRPQQRDGNQRALLLHQLDHLVHAGALGQTMGHQKRRLKGQRAGARFGFVMREAAEIELTAHQALFVHTLVKDGDGRREQKSRADGGITGIMLRFRPCAVLHLTAAGIILRAARYKGNLRSLRQTVKVHIAAPQMLSVLRFPAQRTAPRLRGQSLARAVHCLQLHGDIPPCVTA